MRTLQYEGDVDGLVAVVDDGGGLHRNPAQRLVTRCEEALEGATPGRALNRACSILNSMAKELYLFLFSLTIACDDEG